MEPASAEDASHRKTMWKLALLTREGAEFVIAVPPEGQGEPEALGTQNFSAFADWTRRVAAIARRLGDRLEAGPLTHVAGQNMERQVLLLTSGDRTFLVGWPVDATGNLPEKSRKLVASWDS
jgi:hypothetical protein